MKLKASNFIIQAGNSFSLPLHVIVANSTLKYGFILKEYNVKFSIVFESNSIRSHLHVPQIINSNLTPEIGQVTIPKTGKVILIWDNNFSWIHRKEITYSIQLIEPSTISTTANLYMFFLK